ncbi:sigma factor-like helix-turn-helix DNA-binding protein [Kitasatospora sp. HPMI-4]|uniref:sigma factor-like helix-turn-helix DNA-binding protein n=1 Tax=Kitasatospora sp. HPMI-4 TaxID=3448443 RepID=UPI003F1E023E
MPFAPAYAPHRYNRLPPLEFTALCELHHHRYVQYAHLFLADLARAQAAVRSALEYLADHWEEILTTSNAAACAWKAVTHHVRAAHPGSRAVRRLTDHQQDLVLLHYGLGLPLRDIAYLTGIEEPAVHSQIRAIRIEPDQQAHRPDGLSLPGGEDTC